MTAFLYQEHKEVEKKDNSNAEILFLDIPDDNIILKQTKLIALAAETVQWLT
jgi:hypothetical protein